MPSVYDSPSASEDSDQLQVLSSEECTASSKASTSLEVTVGDPMKAKTYVLLSCKFPSSLSTLDNPNSSSNNELIVEQQTNNTVRSAAKPCYRWLG